MPRLFTGFKIPQELKDYLSLKCSGVPGARWIAPENYHLTVCFIGEVDLATMDEIHHILDNLSGGDPPHLGLGGFGVFGGKKPRSLYAKVEANDVLMQLQLTQKHFLQQIGLPMEKRKYVPHVTLARLRGVTPDIAARFVETGEDQTPLKFTPERLVLYSCKNSRGGGPYVAEEEYDFHGDGAGEASVKTSFSMS